MQQKNIENIVANHTFGRIDYILYNSDENNFFLLKK